MAIATTTQTSTSARFATLQPPVARLVTKILACASVAMKCPTWSKTQEYRRVSSVTSLLEIANTAQKATAHSATVITIF